MQLLTFLTSAVSVLCFPSSGGVHLVHFVSCLFHCSGPSLLCGINPAQILGYMWLGSCSELGEEGWFSQLAVDATSMCVIRNFAILFRTAHLQKSMLVHHMKLTYPIKSVCMHCRINPKSFNKINHHLKLPKLNTLHMFHMKALESSHTWDEKYWRKCTSQQGVALKSGLGHWNTYETNPEALVLFQSIKRFLKC